MENTNIRGILWMLAAAFWASVMVTMVRHMSQELNAFILVFFRNFFAVIMLWAWYGRSGISALKTSRLKMHVARGVVGLIAMLAWFHALSVNTLPVAVTLSFTAPLFTAILSVPLLGERYGWHRISALAVGFCGVLIVLRPGMDAFDPNALFVLASAVFWGMSGVIIKKLSFTDPPWLVTFYITLLLTVLSFPLALFFWQTPTFEQLLWLVALGFVANLFQIALSHAIAKADFAVILPADYFRLVFAILFGWLFFGEVIDTWTVTGAAIIMTSAAYSSYRERKKNHA